MKGRKRDVERGTRNDWMNLKGEISGEREILECFKGKNCSFYFKILLKAELTRITSGSNGGFCINC